MYIKHRFGGTSAYCLAQIPTFANCKISTAGNQEIVESFRNHGYDASGIKKTCHFDSRRICIRCGLSKEKHFVFQPKFAPAESMPGTNCSLDNMVLQHWF